MLMRRKNLAELSRRRVFHGAAARGFRIVDNFIAIAHLRMSKLKHLPASPFLHAIPYDLGRTTHVC